jgi:hypothetical protein
LPARNPAASRSVRRDKPRCHVARKAAQHDKRAEASKAPKQPYIPGTRRIEHATRTATQRGGTQASAHHKPRRFDPRSETAHLSQLTRSNYPYGAHEVTGAVRNKSHKRSTSAA